MIFVWLFEIDWIIGIFYWWWVFVVDIYVIKIVLMDEIDCWFVECFDVFYVYWIRS